jgi:tetratricopeptide (TPR) repeat protein
MENTRLIELRRAYATELAAGRYSSAEQVCWDALEICGYRGPCRKFRYWLNSAHLKESMPEEVMRLCRWARFLADIYYELGKYTEAEPLYAKLAFLWMSLSSESKGRAETRAQLPDLLRKLAAAEAFIGKERRAGKHWTLAKVLSGKLIPAQTMDGTAFEIGSVDISRTGARRSLSSRSIPFTRHRHFRRS